MNRWECPEFLSAARFWNRNPQRGSCRPPSPWLSASALKELPGPGLWVLMFTPKAVSLAQTLPLQCEFTGVEHSRSVSSRCPHTTPQTSGHVHSTQGESPRVSMSDTQCHPSQCTGEKSSAAEIIALIRVKEEGRKVNQLVSYLSCYRSCSEPTE